LTRGEAPPLSKPLRQPNPSRFPRDSANSLECGAHGAAFKTASPTKSFPVPERLGERNHSLECRRPRRRFQTRPANQILLGSRATRRTEPLLGVPAPTAPLSKPLRQPNPSRYRATRRTKPLFGVRRPRRRFSNPPRQPNPSRFPRDSANGTTPWSASAHGAAFKTAPPTKSFPIPARLGERNHSLECRRPRRRFSNPLRQPNPSRFPSDSANELAPWSAAPTAPLSKPPRNPNPSRFPRDSANELAPWSAAPTAPLSKPPRQPNPSRFPSHSASEIAPWSAAPTAPLSKPPRQPNPSRFPRDSANELAPWSAAPTAPLSKPPRNPNPFRFPRDWANEPAPWSAAPTAPLSNPPRNPNPSRFPRDSANEPAPWSAAPTAPLSKPPRQPNPSRYRATRRTEPLLGVPAPTAPLSKPPRQQNPSRFPSDSANELAPWSAGAHGAAFQTRLANQIIPGSRATRRTNSLLGVRRPRRRFSNPPRQPNPSRFPSDSANGTTPWSAGAHGAAFKPAPPTKSFVIPARLGERTRSLECGAHGAAFKTAPPIEAVPDSRATRRTNPLLGVPAPTAPLSKPPRQPNPSRFPRDSANETTLWSAGAHGAAFKPAPPTKSFPIPARLGERNHSLECGAHGAALARPAI
jgi:hypothetical protein